MKVRGVTCPLRNACPMSRKPASSEVCQRPACSYEWIPSKWTEVSGAPMIVSIVCIFVYFDPDFHFPIMICTWQVYIHVIVNN